MPIGRPGVLSIPLLIEQPIDSHRETSGKDHAQEHAQRMLPSKTIRNAFHWRWQNPSPKRGEHRKRKGKDRVAESNQL